MFLGKTFKSTWIMCQLCILFSGGDSTCNRGLKICTAIHQQASASVLPTFLKWLLHNFLHRHIPPSSTTESDIVVCSTIPRALYSSNHVLSTLNAFQYISREAHMHTFCTAQQRISLMRALAFNVQKTAHMRSRVAIPWQSWSWFLENA